MPAPSPARRAGSRTGPPRSPCLEAHRGVDGGGVEAERARRRCGRRRTHRRLALIMASTAVRVARILVLLRSGFDLPPLPLLGCANHALATRPPAVALSSLRDAAAREALADA